MCMRQISHLTFNTTSCGRVLSAVRGNLNPNATAQALSSGERAGGGLIFNPVLTYHSKNAEKAVCGRRRCANAQVVFRQNSNAELLIKVRLSLMASKVDLSLGKFFLLGLS